MIDMMNPPGLKPTTHWAMAAQMPAINKYSAEAAWVEFRWGPKYGTWYDDTQFPKEALDNEHVLRLILPALRSDTALYRNYIYQDRPPLECPIHAFGGTEDPVFGRKMGGVGHEALGNQTLV